MTPKINQSALENHEFTQIMTTTFPNETPKITYTKNSENKYKFKIHFKNLIFNSNIQYSSYMKGIKSALTEAVPLLKLYINKNYEHECIKNISIEQLNNLITKAEENEWPQQEIDYDSIKKQKFDFSDAFQNYDMAETYEDLENSFELEKNKRIKTMCSDSLKGSGSRSSSSIISSNIQKSEKEDSKDKLHNLTEKKNSLKEKKIKSEKKPKKSLNFSSKRKKSREAEMKKVLKEEKEIKEKPKKEKMEVKKEEKVQNKLENTKNDAVYAKKLIKFIKTNELPMFLKENKSLKKLHKCIVKFIDEKFESKYAISIEKAEEDVFKKICSEYELLDE